MNVSDQVDLADGFIRFMILPSTRFFSLLNED